MIPEEVRQQALREIAEQALRELIDDEKQRILARRRSFWGWFPFTITITRKH